MTNDPTTPAGERDRSREYLGRHVCTATDPYDATKHGTHSAHPEAKVIGGSPCGSADDFLCPHCGTKWRDWYDAN